MRYTEEGPVIERICDDGTYSSLFPLFLDRATQIKEARQAAECGLTEQTLHGGYTGYRNTGQNTLTALTWYCEI